MAVAAVLFDRAKNPEEKKLNHFLEITASKIKKFTDEIYLFTDRKEVKTDFKKIFFDKTAGFLDFLSNTVQDKTVLLLNAYSPLLDTDSLKKMLSEHEKFIFDFTYPENLPAGFLPEIIDSGIAGFIKNTIPENLGMFQNGIKEIFERDLSSYDCNIFISECDLVKYRLNFIPDNRNDFLITEQIIEKYGSNFTISGIGELFEKEPKLIRKRPTYVEIEWTTEREAGEFFISNRLQRNGEMKPEDFQKILEEIRTFAGNPVVSIGLFGEPFVHSDAMKMIDILAGYPEIEFLIESRCILSDFSPVEKAISLPNVKVIFDISFAGLEGFEKNKKSDNSIRPFEGLASLEQKIKVLPKEKIYVQYTRATENENELLPFYEKWRDYGDRIIIKKPDTYGGLLDQYRVVDLSPIKRFPCLHLKHDLVVFYDGCIPVCRQDFNGNQSAGNILNEGIEHCWEKLSEIYYRQWKEDYKNPPICEKCDEWWVFNF